MTVFSNGEIVNNGVVMEGSSVDIICSAAYSMEEAVYLFKILHYDNGYNKERIINVSHVNNNTRLPRFTYTIFNITMDQFGIYACRVFALDNQQYQVVYGVHYVVVMIAPTLTSYNTTAVEGDRVVLLCPGKNFDSIIWKSNKRDVYNDSLILFNGNGTNKMIIKRISRDYADIYKCRAVAREVVTDVVAHIQLVVFYPSSILEHPSNKTVTVGESVEFRCVVNGHPTPSITWKRNGFLLDLRQSELDKYVSKYYESNVGSIITLEVKNVEREEESDYYTCKVENDYGILESRKAYLLITALQTSAITPVAARKSTSSTNSFGSGSAVELTSGDEDSNVIQTNLHFESTDPSSETSIPECSEPYDQPTNVTTKNDIEYAVNNKFPRNSNSSLYTVAIPVGILAAITAAFVTIAIYQKLARKRSVVSKPRSNIPRRHQEEMRESNYSVESTVHPFEGNIFPFTIGPEGGEYRAGGIAISVPAGACQTYEQITVQSVFKNEPITPLDSETFRFSGDLVLEPHGLQFHVPIEIQFPFTAVQRGWTMFLMREEPGKGWTTVLSFDGDTGQVIERDSHCDYDPNTNTLKLSHFCKYSWCGCRKENATSSMKVLDCLFFSKMTTSGNSCDFVLHFCDDCRDIYKEVKKMETIERHPRFNFANRRRILISREGDLNVKVISSHFKVDDIPEFFNQAAIQIPLSFLWPEQHCGTLCKVSFRANLPKNLAEMEDDPILAVDVTAADQVKRLDAIINRPQQRSNTSTLSRISLAESSNSLQSDLSSGRGSISPRQASSDSVHDLFSSPARKPDELLRPRSLDCLGPNEIMNETNSANIFQKLSDNLGHNWKCLARCLHLQEAEIENIEADYRGQQKEQGYYVLKTWAKKQGATRAVLFDALMAVIPSGSIFDCL
ncbi:uncharacterized protein LOC134195087 isoform X2 [Corticium candelabrum]|nr:uncharacterized protein LOC134195087 isoform X2 [Corticium candelabrum]